MAANFSKMNLQAHRIDNLIAEQPQRINRNNLEKSKEILLGFDENMDGITYFNPDHSAYFE